MEIKLILENGEVLVGESIGYKGTVVGELVFTTSMTGYQEILTDPSYFGQIVVMTYPLIGNYGLNLEDNQSINPSVRGFVVKSDAKLPNNFRCEMNLNGYLNENKIPGIKGVDTRYLTKIIRENGAMKAIITTEELTNSEIKELFDKFSNVKSVSQVSRKEALEIEGTGEKIAIIDCGIKQNIIESFKKRNCHLKIFPYNVTIKEIEEFEPKAIFLSNGPGDPEDVHEVIQLTKDAIARKIPIIGICLGHQIVALAMGGKIGKMKFGHRGGNHPVKDLEHNKIFISSQNHGYEVSELPKGMELSYVNLNDNTVEGMKNKEMKIMTVQFHPEACPGPEETSYIFDEFLEIIK